LAVEDPGPHRYRRLAEAAGLAVVPVPCDQDGLEVGHLDRSGARAVLVTPAHQYPLGITMSPARRTALVEWARRRQALIIEDDYDGEFRYDRQPAGAAAAPRPRSRDLCRHRQQDPRSRPAAGLSPPASIGAAITAAKEHADRGTSVLDQLTLAQLIATGAFDRHVRRMRGIYRRRRDDLAQALARSHAGLHLAGISAGLHALALLPQDGPTEQQIRSRAARRSIALHTLGRYWHNPPQPGPQAVIIGYGTPADHAYRPALSALTQLLTDPR
jgi:GntR family transcriptional regulator / MocR family aminotransferase